MTLNELFAQVRPRIRFHGQPLQPPDRRELMWHMYGAAKWAEVEERDAHIAKLKAEVARLRAEARKAEAEARMASFCDRNPR